MERRNVLINMFIIFALMFIGTPSEAGGYKMLHYDEEFPAYPWQRFVYRERVARTPKRNNSESTGKDMGDFSKDAILVPDIKMSISVIKAQLKKLGKDSRVSVIYGHVPAPTVLVSYYSSPCEY